MIIKQEKFYRPKWGLLWHSQNRLDGVREHLLYKDGMPLVFPKRDAARAYAQTYFRDLKTRRDLRMEPHGYRMPRLVKLLGIRYLDTKG
mgnify:FL=1